MKKIPRSEKRINHAMVYMSEEAKAKTKIRCGQRNSQTGYAEDSTLHF